MRSIRIDSALQGQTQVFAQARDAAVLDSGFGLEFKRGDDWPGIDLRDVPRNVKLGAFLLDGARAILQIGFVHFLAALGHSAANQRAEVCNSYGPI